MKPYAFILLAVLFVSCSKDKNNTAEPETPDNPVVVSHFQPTAALTGQTVTITGKGFGTSPDAVKVQFADGATITPNTAKDNELTVEVPVTAITGKISVTVGNGTAVKSYDNFTVLPPQPTFISMAPLTGPAGQEVIITGTNFGTDASKIKVVFANGTTAFIKAITPTQITILIGISGNTGALTVTLTGANPVNTPAFTMILPDTYVIKTIGFGWLNVGVDKEDHMTVAELYGGGNRIVLKAGTGNTMEALGANIQMWRDDLGTAGNIRNYGGTIDNGNPPTSTNGEVGMVLKIKGFDKSKTGYNELNLVMQKHVWAMEPLWGGYISNYNYLTLFEKPNSKNTDYGKEFMEKILSGNVKVVSVEIAKPKAEKPYITNDQYISYASTVVALSNNKTVSLDFGSQFFMGSFSASASSSSFNVGSPLKMEWVNANNGTVVKISDYDYGIKFNNIKSGNWDQVVEPADSVNKVFLRVTGFDPAVCGFNQLRLFITDDSYDHGEVSVGFATKPGFVPTVDYIKNSFTLDGLRCQRVRQKYP